MRRIIIVILSVAIVTIVSACDIADFYTAPSDYVDETVVSWHIPLDTIQNGYAFAYNRVSEWAKFAKLRLVTISFVGEQIESHKGLIEYVFSADNGKDPYIADATVTVDMETITSPKLYAWFDVRTRGSRRIDNGEIDGWSNIAEMDMAEWTLTIDEAFDIMYSEVGKNAFAKFESLKITLVCFSDVWIFYVSKEDEEWFWAEVNYIISINPITKKVLDVEGFDVDGTLAR